MADTALLIADIGGYTRFLRENRFAAAHAHDAIARLLEAVIDAARPFKLAKLEGDAAFLYAPLEKVKDPGKVTRLAGQLRAEFIKARDRISNTTLCPCQACTEVGALKLKVVAHAGEVAFQRVKRLTELAGVDVILVHRMLKNDVPLTEYVLFTEPLQASLEPDLRQKASLLEHDFEGLGRTPTWYLDLAEVTPPVSAARPPSMFYRQLKRVVDVFRLMPLVLRLKKPCQGFRNVQVVEAQALPSGVGSDPGAE